jgi:hypothetical protein
MKRRHARRRGGPSLLARGIQALAAAAPRVRPRAVLARWPGLPQGELLVAVADAGSVAVQRVKIAAPTGARGAPDALPSPAELGRRLAAIEMIASELAQGEIAAPAPPLTDLEARTLRAGGLDPAPLVSAADAAPAHRTIAEYARLLHDSYSVEQAAALLGVNPSRVRQRLTGRPRTLYGIKAGRSWRVPKFQFAGRQLVPGVERVVARLAPDLHPVAVHRWFTAPNPDLTAADTAMTPRDWLRVGNRVEAVVELAAGL